MVNQRIDMPNTEKHKMNCNKVAANETEKKYIKINGKEEIIQQIQWVVSWL